MKKHDNNSRALDLFLLMFNISQLSIKEKIIDVFISALGEIWSGLTVIYLQAKPDSEENIIEISASGSNYGYLSIEDITYVKNDDLALIHNAAAMLAVILKKNEQDILLADEKLHLQKLVDERLLAILESEAKYRNIFENIQDVFYETSLEGIILEVSPSISVISKGQYNRNDLVGKLIFDFYKNPEARENLISALHEKGQVNDFEIQLINRDGSVIQCSITSKVLLNDSGLPLKIIGSMRDITERKRAEEASRISEQKYRNIFENAPLGIYQSTNEGKFIGCNTALANMLGYSSPEEMMRLVTNIAKQHYSEAPTRNKEINAALGEDGYVTLENKYRRVNGTTWIGRAHSRIVHDEPGKPIYYEGFVEDITERVQNEKRIADLVERLSLSQEVSSAGSWDWDIQNNTFYWSEEFLKLFGMEPGTVPGFESWTKSLHPDDIELASQKIQDAIDEKTDLLQHYRIVLPGGNLRWIRAMGKTNYQNDIPVRMIGLCIDVTDQKQAEEALKSSEARFKKLFNNSTFGIIIGQIIRDENGKAIDYVHLQANDALFKHVGVKPEDVIGKRTSEIISKEEADYFIDKFSQVVETGNPFEYEQYFPLFDRTLENGSFYLEDDLFAVAFVDITARKKAVEALESQHALLTALINSSSDIIIFSVDKNYRYTTFNNNHWKEMKQVWNSDIEIGMSLLDCMHIPEIRELAKQSIDRALNGNSFTEIQHQPELGIYYEFSWNPIFQQKQVIGATVFIRDITGRTLAEQKVLESKAKLSKSLEMANQSRQSLLSVLEDQREAEKEIQRLNSELEQRVIERTSQLEAANKEMEAFSYSVSHDLRSPLRHINGFAEILTKQYSEQLPEDARKHLNTIVSSAKRMGTLIDDLLSFSRTGRAELKKSTLKMNQVIEDALAQIKHSIIDRKIDWKISQLPDVHGDYNLLRLVWVNLLENAVKYTKHKKKAIIQIGYKEEKREIVFYIKDNGVGFDMKYADKLFGVFQRLHSSSEFDGTGIGLANVQRIILRHGGKVWAEAETDKGATFYFSIPKEQEDKP